MAIRACISNKRTDYALAVLARERPVNALELSLDRGEDCGQAFQTEPTTNGHAGLKQRQQVQTSSIYPLPHICNLRERESWLVCLLAV